MTLGGYYLDPHQSQYQAGASATTKTQGCTWTTGSNGANASSGGKIARTPDQVLALVKTAEQTNPATPGWSLPDLALAMKRLGVPFEDRSGQGWTEVGNAHRAGLYLALQGDSDQFGTGTCSGTFKGDHCIGVHPASRTNPDSTIEWWIDDPICPTGRWEAMTTLQRYAQKFSATVDFGAFTHAVPKPVPTRFKVGLGMYTPIWDAINGNRIGAARRVSYICTRRPDASGQMWYRVVSRLDGSKAAWAGRWFYSNAGTTVKPA
jgi:hypothetical protein